MPTYGYECKSCGHTFDAFQSMSDEPIRVCPECGKEVRRLINGGTGVIFKGSGFYVTDKGKGGSAGGVSKPSTKPPSGGASAESSAEAAGRGSPPEKSSDKSAGSSSASDSSSSSSGGSSTETGNKPKTSEAKQPAKS
jgi:putative FmdB family regulatory protein